MKDKLTSLYSRHKAVFQRFSVLVIVTFVVSAIGFVTRVKLANELGKELFGLFAYGLAIATYTSTYVRYGMDRTLMRDLVHDREHQSQYVASSLLLRTILFVTVVIGLLVWKFFSGPSADLTAGVILLVLGQSLIGLELKSLYDSWHMMHRHAIYNLVQRCLYFGLIWGVCLFFPESLSVFWIGTFSLIAASFYLAMQCAWAFKRIDFHGVGDSLFKHTWDMARNNLIIWLSCMSSLFMVSFNQLILKHYYGIDSLGGYAAAWQIVAIAMLLIGQIARIGNPTMARITKPGVARKERVAFLIKYAAVMLAVVSPLSIIMIVCPKLIMGLIFKPEYLTAAGALRYMGLYVMLFSIGIVASQYVISARLDRIYLASTLVGGAVGILTCFLLIPSMKEQGTVLALLISHGTSISIYIGATFINLKTLEGVQGE